MVTLKYITENCAELNVIISLFKEYANELNEDLCFQSFGEELDNPLTKYGKPNGALILALLNNEPVGCVALTDITAKPTSHQPLQEKNADTNEKVCEMKRLYVKPFFRKNKMGEVLVEAIIEAAKELNYTKMKLDTLERLQAAIKLYQKHGFIITNAYYKNPLPNVVYMELRLK